MLHRLIKLFFVGFSLITTAYGELSCSLVGGLGNQMFQVASVTALAWDVESPVSFPHLAQTPSRIILLKLRVA